MKNNFLLFILLLSSSLYAQKENAAIISCDSISYGIDTASAEKRSLHHHFKLKEKDLLLNSSIYFEWSIVNIDLDSDILKKDTISIQINSASTDGEFHYLKFEESGYIRFGKTIHADRNNSYNYFQSKYERTYKIEGDILVVGYSKRHWWYKYKKKTKYTIIWNGNYCANLLRI